MTLFEEVVHTSILGIYLTTSVIAFSSIEKMENSTYPEVKFMSKSIWRFCTNWGFTIQTIYYVCIVVSHYLRRSQGTLKLGESLRTFSDFIFTILVLPIGMGITSFFWTIFTKQREMILPSSVDEAFPPWLNHVFHTFNSVLPLMDMLLTKHKIPSWSLSGKVIVTFMGTYFVCLIETRMRYGRHLYIFMKYYSMAQVGGCVSVGILIAFAFHAAVRCICKWRWGPSIFEASPGKQNLT